MVKKIERKLDERLREHEVYPNMWWVSWDEDEYEDFFNITRALEHLRRQDEDRNEMD